MNGRDMFEEDSNSVNCDPPGMSSEWRFPGENQLDRLINVVPTNDSVQISLDYSISTDADQAGFGCIDARTIARSTDSTAMIPSISMLKEALFLENAPGELPQFPADSGLIERPAWFSSFSDGNLGVMMNNTLTGLCSREGTASRGPRDAFLDAWLMQFCKNDRNFDKNSRGIYPGMDPTESEVYWIKNEGRTSVLAKSDEVSKQRELATSNEPDDNEFADANDPEETSNINAKKRKRIYQSIESDTAEEKHTNEPNPDSTAETSTGKHDLDASNSPNKDYIHVRARRGQATNSHSLAERVRREKISDRMKLLQDLVPGCNKVSGKAVMLDEIINYVQSLQRQVEFLSMKLAAVNPSMNLNAETHHLQPGSSSAPGFFQIPQPVFFNPNLNPSCFSLRSINPQLTSLIQPSVWEDELGNAVNITSGATHYRHNQDRTGKGLLFSGKQSEN